MEAKCCLDPLWQPGAGIGRGPRATKYHSPRSAPSGASSAEGLFSHAYWEERGPCTAHGANASLGRAPQALTHISASVEMH